LNLFQPSFILFRMTPSLACLLALAGSLSAASFVDSGADPAALPEVIPGFAVTVFAKEPLVRNPCSIAFDARGRMFVSQGPQYRNPTPKTPPDSVTILQDTDGDGVADRTHVFATGFNCIQSLAWRGRDLWVANAPDLTVVRDLDGDDVADEYVKVFTDLGNIEHGLHGLNFAPDGRLYMSKGNSKGVVLAERKADEPDRLAPKPFRELRGVPGPPDAPDFPPPKTFTKDNYRSTYQDPRDDWGRMGGILRCEGLGKNLEIVARGFRNPYGLGFDHGFDWLGTDQDQTEGDRLFMSFFGAEFGWSHAWSSHWTGENHLPTVPISGPVFQGSGTGVLFADSPAWPARYRGVWIINDWLLKSTHVYRPIWQGALLQPEGGKWEDFVTGKDALYRPVDLAFGADGALYVVGWGRGYGLEVDQVGAMTNEGRIFRIMPKGAAALPPPAPTDWPTMTVAQLLAEFQGVLPVRRISAQDELARRGAAVQQELTAALQSGQLSLAQETWALWALARAGGDDAFFTTLCGQPERSLNARVQALRILGDRKSPKLADVVPPALGTPEPRLRFAAVQTVHQAQHRELLPVLIAHAAGEKDRVTYFATWRAMRDLGAAATLTPLLADSRPGVRCAALLALLDLGAMRPADLQSLTRDPDEMVRGVALLGLGKTSSPEGKAAAPGTVAPQYSPAANLSAESKRPYSAGLLRTGQPVYTDRSYALRKVPEALNGATILRTANADDASRGESFFTFDLALDTTVLVAHDVRIKNRPAWLQAFADTDLTVTTDDTTFRLWSKDFPAGRVTLGGNLPERATGPKANYFVVLQPKSLPPHAVPTKESDALAALKNANAARGEALFFLNAGCAACHRAGERGTNFGPDLSALGNRMEARFVVQAMLDPNAVITEGFAAHAIEAGGKSYFGILLSTGKTVKLGLAGGETVEIPAASITKHETLPISPMPPQSALLGPQDVADLTAWLLTQKAEAAAPVSTPMAPLVPPTPLAISQDPLTAIEKPDRLILLQGQAPLGEFVFRDPAIRRPFFANLRAPGGLQVTRNFPPVAGKDATDHADMHPGLWLGFGDLAGEDFWRNKGTIRHDRFTAAPVWEKGSLTFATQSTLLTAKDAALATLVCRFTVTPKGHALRIVWDAAITPLADGFYFGDQEEMGLGVRVATEITEKNGGTITSSEGVTGAAQTWGKPAAWCDYSGLIAGRHAGITIVPDPANARPSWWHNRDYGVFVANAFGRQAMKQGDSSRIEVPKGETYRLRHTIILHSSENAQAPNLQDLVKAQD
jgi:putative membrane-bound dehydrogenase-like protein